jgi:uncharacterized protein
MSQVSVLTRLFQKTLSERLSVFTPLIQIISGPRQVGKTTAVKEFLKEHPNNSTYLTFDNPGRDPHQTIRFEVQRLLKVPGHKILILDEIQNVPNWAPLIKEIYDLERGKRELSIGILGSSTLDILLRGEESLLGRFELIRAPHWNLHEMKALYNWGMDDYLKFGGYPILGELWNERTEREVARCSSFVRDAIIEPVITKDIFSLQSVVNTAMFRQLLQIVLSLPCQEISFSKLIGQLSDKLASATIKNYLELMERGFLITLLYRYSGGKIRQRTSTPKIVPLSTALIHAFSDATKIDTDSAWFGHVYEAAVISVFQRMGLRLSYWSNSRQDVDLVVESPKYTCAIEIKSTQSADYTGLDAFKREFPHAKTLMINRDIGDALLAASDPFEIFTQLVTT